MGQHQELQRPCVEPRDERERRAGDESAGERRERVQLHLRRGGKSDERAGLHVRLRRREPPEGGQRLGGELTGTTAMA